MVRKKASATKRIFIIGLIVAFAIFMVLWGTGVIHFNSGLPRLSIGDVPSGCNIYGSGTTDNQFTCQSNECDVNGWRECIESTGDIPTVIFRTDTVNGDFKNSGSWIAWDVDSDGDLDCFVRGGNPSPTANIPFINTIRLPSSMGDMKFYGNPQQIFTVNDESTVKSSGSGNYQADRYTRYFSGSGCNMTPIATEPYKSKNQEIYSGTMSRFVCETPWSIKTSSGSVISSGNAVYSGQLSGKYQTDVKRINKGETFFFPGKINYAIIDASKACSIDLCNSDNTGIIKCVKQGSCMVKSDVINLCNSGEFCIDKPTGAICQAPFETSMDIQDGFTTSDRIQFTYSIKSDTVSNVIVTFKLIDTRDKTKILQIAGPSTLNLPDSKVITFNNPGLIGSYQIIVEKTYNGIKVSDEVFDFRIGNPLELVVKIPYSPLTSTNLLTNSAFYVDVIASENGIPTTELVDVSMVATLKKSNGQSTNVIIPAPIKVDDSFRYIFTVTEPGLFEVTTKATKFGVVSNEIKRDSEIREQKIDIQFTNIGLIKNSKPGLITIKFETKDPFGNYLPVNYQVKVIPSGASTGSGDIVVTSTVTGTNGVYEFAYNFGRGAYLIQVDATATGYSVQSSSQSPAINIDESATQVECSSSEECSAGYICNSSGQCVKKDQPFLLYVIIVLAVIFIIVLIVIIGNLSKKRRVPQQVSLGSGM